MAEEDKTVYIEKPGCYRINLPFKEVPFAIKNLPQELEYIVQS